MNELQTAQRQTQLAQDKLLATGNRMHSMKHTMQNEMQAERDKIIQECKAQLDQDRKALQMQEKQASDTQMVQLRQQANIMNQDADERAKRKRILCMIWNFHCQLMDRWHHG